MLSILRSTGGDFGRYSRTFRPLSEAHARFWLHLPLQQAIKHATGYKECNGRRARCNIDRMCCAPVRDATCNIGCHAACHGRSPRKGSHASARRLASVRARACVRVCVNACLGGCARACILVRGACARMGRRGAHRAALLREWPRYDPPGLMFGSALSTHTAAAAGSAARFAAQRQRLSWQPRPRRKE